MQNKIYLKEKTIITYDNINTISFAKIHSEAKIPTKREEDACYDVYAAFDEDFITIEPHKVKLIPTGIISAFSPKWRITARERGSGTKTNLGQKAGVIDSGYRGEWFVALRNDNDIPIKISKLVTDNQFCKDAILTPYTKAICQIAIEEVPIVDIIEENPDIIKSYVSLRGDGRLGSSGA